MNASTTSQASTPPAPKLRALANRAGRALGRDALVSRALVAAALLGGVLATAVVVDAVLALPVVGRAALLMAWCGALVAGAGWCVAGWRAWRRKPGAALLKLERVQAVSGEVLINAWELAGPAKELDQQVSRALRAAVIERGEQLAPTITTTGLGDRAARRRAVWLLIAVLGVLAVSGAVRPKVWGDVLPRLALPFADLPAYTPLRFDIVIDPQPVMHGDGARVRTAITHPAGMERVPDQAELVIQRDGARPRRAALSPVATNSDGARVFERGLEPLTHGLRAYVATAGGRSRTFEVSVVPAPRVAQAAVTVTPPGYTGLLPAEISLNESADQPINILAGSTLTWRVAGTLPLEAATLTLTAEDGDAATPFDLDADDPLRATLTHTPERDARYAISLLGPGRTPGRTSPTGQLIVRRDAPARAAWQSPAGSGIAPPDQHIDLHAIATDDVRLLDGELAYQINDGPLAMLATRRDQVTTRRQSLRGRVGLTSLDVAAGDRVTLWAVVSDPNPESEPQTQPGTPRITRVAGPRIEVVTAEAYLEAARQRFKVDALEREWAAWRQRVEQAIRDDDPAAQEQLARAMRERAGEPALNAIDKAARDRLNDLADRIESLQNGAPPPDADAQAAQQAADQVGEDLGRLSDAAAMQRAAASGDSAALESLSSRAASSLPQSAQQASQQEAQQAQGDSNSAQASRAMEQALARDLDGALGQSGQTLTEALKSIAEAQGAGQAQSATGAGGMAEGSPALLGPHAALNPPGDAPPDQAGNPGTTNPDNNDGDGNTAGGADGIGLAGNPASPERLIPDAQGDRRFRAPALDALPPRFRALTDDYFKRLAQDASPDTVETPGDEP